MQQTKQTQKPAKAMQKPAKAQTTTAKGNTSAKAGNAAKAVKTPFYAGLYLAIMADKFGARCKAYYQRADAYHAKQKTIFPRVRTEEARKGMDRTKAMAIIARASSGTLAAGAADGQALYDLMKIKADAK